MKKIFVVLALLIFTVNLGSHIQDEEFFATFVAPYVMIILDTSGSMCYNMAEEMCYGDGTIGGNTRISGHDCVDPFYGLSATHGSRPSDEWGDKSRVHIVKSAICDVLDEVGGQIRWGLATFYQVKNSSGPWSVSFYRAYYGTGNTQYVTPDLEWEGAQTTYANDQFMLRVTISEAKGQNESHINEIRKYMDSEVNSYNDQNELRASCYTPIPPALRGARYWYSNEIKNLSSQEKWCRKHFVILLTDGEPTVGVLQADYGAGKGDKARLSSYAPDVNHPPQWMKNQSYWEADSLRHTFVEGKGTDPDTTFDIKTFVVGLGTAISTLDTIAIRGGTGHYYYAGSSEEVTQALRDIFAQIIHEAFAFSAGEVTSIEEDFLSTEYEARMYLASFFPGSGAFWEGHLRALTLELGGLSLDSIPEDRIIWDAGNLLRSRNPSTRDIYAVKGGYLVEFDSTNFDETDLDVASSAEADTVINLVRCGSSSTSDTIAYLGDIFHSAPLRIGAPTYWYRDDGFVQYRDSLSSRTPVIYAGSNTGMLHAFYDETGEELFAVIPKNFVPEVKELADSHRFYVDADPMAADVWFPSDDADTFKDANEWRTVLMASQGEGGMAITCLDVTNPGSPSHLFSFEDDTMGLTTSVPVMYKVGRIVGTDTTERFFAFFGGGECPDSLYDMYNPLSSVSLKGNVIIALDIYDAYTSGLGEGSSYWYIQPASGDADKMIYPFAAAGSVVNLNPRYDNLYDLLYIPDLAGQMWKVDVTDPDVSNWTAKCIFQPPIPTAASQDEPDQIPSQPAFFAPFIEREPATGCLWIFYGTGDRSKVFKENTSNRFYAILDTLTDAADVYPLTEDDLKRVWTDGPFDFPSEFPDYKGWYIVFNDSTGHTDEKVVSQATLLLDTLIFATFDPGESSNPCEPNAGVAREYSCHFRTGRGRGKVVGMGIPQAPRYTFDQSGSGYEIHQTFDSLWIQQKTGYGTLKRILQWKER
jgi:hypothetical protein